MADLDPASLLRGLRAPALDVDAAVSVREVELELGPARLAIERGFVVPARVENGQIVELVFIGQARFRFDPPDAIEAGQLELFTGERRLDAAVDEAVLVLPGGALQAQLLGRPTHHEPRPELLARAAEIHSSWLESAERRITGIAAALFKSLIGDRAFQDYFAIRCSSFEVGEFLYRMDPEEVEQVTLASYNPLELSYRQRQELLRYMRVQRRRGRWLGLRVEDLGGWDVWSSTRWAPVGKRAAGGEGFEPRHYTLDVTLRRGSRLLEGSARIELECRAPGRRTVRLELMRDMLVERIGDGRGRELFWFRSGDEVVVLLPEAPPPGAELTLEVDFAGRALRWVDGRNYDLTDTGTWYPHVGTIDRATYDVTLRWPTKLDLFASGSLVEQGRDRGYLWQRRRLEVPAIAFSFVLGRYDVERTRLGEVDVTVAFNRTSRVRTTEAARTEVVATIRRALDFFEQTFGPYPLDELTVVTHPRRFSQSYLSFVTLARSILGYQSHFGASSAWLRDTTIAHELAHQWWGNLIGWWSYRDQWLSEGMANYAALLYDVRTNGAESNLLSILSAGWRDSLNQTTSDGRTIESLGPVVLGNRLNSSQAGNAYRPIVYRKGAVVLAMLARAAGEERFVEMLRSLSEASANRVVTTQEFIAAIERMSGLDLDGFARQYVYGTGIPQVYYRYTTTPATTGGWTLRGEARRARQPSFRYEVVRSSEGRLDLQRGLRPETARATALMVPFRLTLAERAERPELQPGREGRLVLEGVRHDFEIAASGPPQALQLDPRGEVLANFCSERDDPKRYLRYRAEDLALLGRWDEAEALFRDALRAPSVSPARPDPLRPRPGPGSDYREDLRIRLALVRLGLEQGRDAAARAELDAIDQAWSGSDAALLKVERDVLRARLEMRAGEYASARRRLKKLLRSVERGGGWHRPRSRASVYVERGAVVEAYGLLAIAVSETAGRDELAWATRAAAERGVDVSLLEQSDRPASTSLSLD